MVIRASTSCCSENTFNVYVIVEYLTNRLHFSVRVYCNRSHSMTSQYVKNKKYVARHSDCCSLHAVTSSVIYYSTRARENVLKWKNMFHTKQIYMVYWRILGVWKEKNKCADVIWRGFDAIDLCVSFTLSFLLLVTKMFIALFCTSFSLF